VCIKVKKGMYTSLLMDLRAMGCQHMPHGNTQHLTQVDACTLSTASQAGTRFTYTGRRVDLGGWLRTKVIYLSTGSHPSKQ